MTGLSKKALLLTVSIRDDPQLHSLAHNPCAESAQTLCSLKATGAAPATFERRSGPEFARGSFDRQHVPTIGTFPSTAEAHSADCETAGPYTPAV